MDTAEIAGRCPVQCVVVYCPLVQARTSRSCRGGGAGGGVTHDLSAHINCIYSDSPTPEAGVVTVEIGVPTDLVR